MGEERLVPKLRFSGFDEGWSEVKLGDISTFLDNKRVPLKEDDRKQMKGKYPYYGASGIIDYIDDYIFDEELILMGEDGANIVTRSSKLIFLAKGKYWVNNHAHVIKANSDINQYFLSESLERINYEKYNTGTAQPKLNREVCQKIKVKIPEYSEQNKIASFLIQIDQKIELLKQKHEKYQDFKKYLMQQIFAQKLRFANFEDDWTTKRLGEIVEFLDNKRIPLNEDERSNQKNIYPYYGASGVIDHVEDYIFDEELILIGEDGTIDVNLASGKYWVSNHAHVLRANNDVNQHYLFEFLKTVHFEIYNTGTIQPKLNKETCKTIPIKMPKSFEEQKLIANCLFEAENRIKICKKQINITNKFKKGLLQQIFV